MKESILANESLILMKFLSDFDLASYNLTSDSQLKPFFPAKGIQLTNWLGKFFIA